MELDALLLSRIQFAANITFHILFPTITIALGWFLLFFKMRFNATQDTKWMDAYFFWTKVFALSFAMGVVSGITMSFQFGTNWPGFMERVGNIAGPLLAYEVLTAFFLEATFLGIMLFGFRRVPGWLHTTSTVLVAVGTTASAFWILVLNSWMHTPVGFEMLPTGPNGMLQAHATDWLAILSNPSLPYRFSHKLLASGLTASFLIAGLSAYRWLRHDQTPSVKAAMGASITLAAILIPIQIFVGDLHGLNTLQYQPQKVAAMEGLWETRSHAPLVLFALPDEESRTNHFSLEIPSLTSIILKHHSEGVVQGLNDFVDNHPPVAPVFWGFRIMVGMGMLMLIVSWAAAYMWWRHGDVSRWMAYILLGMTFSGWVATLAGWYVTEIGRQPWLVQNVLSTAEAVAPVHGSYVAITLAAYLAVYVVLLIAYISTLFYLARKASTEGKDNPESPTALGIERKSVFTEVDKVIST